MSHLTSKMELILFHLLQNTIIATEFMLKRSNIDLFVNKEITSLPLIEKLLLIFEYLSENKDFSQKIQSVLASSYWQPREWISTLSQLTYYCEKHPQTDRVTELCFKIQSFIQNLTVNEIIFQEHFK